MIAITKVMTSLTHRCDVVLVGESLNYTIHKIVLRNLVFRADDFFQYSGKYCDFVVLHLNNGEPKQYMGR